MTVRARALVGRGTAEGPILESASTECKMRASDVRSPPDNRKNIYIFARGKAGRARIGPGSLPLPLSPPPLFHYGIV